jgi:hypothetical protein
MIFTSLISILTACPLILVLCRKVKIQLFQVQDSIMLTLAIKYTHMVMAQQREAHTATSELLTWLTLPGFEPATLG